MQGREGGEVNVKGGVIGEGQAWGVRGERGGGMMVRGRADRDVEYGLATMCSGVGQGIASIWQKVELLPGATRKPCVRCSIASRAGTTSSTRFCRAAPTPDGASARRARPD